MDALMKRFLSHVDKSGDCWMWLLGKDKDGYGKIKVAGKHLRAHRLSYELHIGLIPKGLFILHKCDVPGCVNPDHLWPGTATDNNRDRETKKRGRYRNKIHCINGHEYTPENTSHRDGYRRCLICRRATTRKSSRRYYRRMTG